MPTYGETKAGEQFDFVKESCAELKDLPQAVSAVVPFEEVKNIPGIEIPLRRPVRTFSASNACPDSQDVESARSALEETDDLQPYEEFRKDLRVDE